MGIVDRINNNLATLYNVENDDIYKSLICDKDGTIPSTITKPTDIDIGAMASQIEYLRLLSIDLVKQIYIDQASGDFLKYQLEEFFNSLRLENETDADWVQRTIDLILKPKVSRASIIYSLRPYSSLEPEITTVTDESAFADVCFADVYNSYSYELDGITWFFVPAVAENYQFSFYTVKIILYDTETSDVVTVQNLIENMLAAGISYILVIQST
jgi:hypothetical protein